MSIVGLEQTLRNLPSLGKLVKDRGYRQVWRFEHGGKGYYLKFYPRAGFRDRVRRIFRGSPALAEFSKLQKLQVAKISAPRAVAVLMGFQINARTGDAVILEEIAPAVQLDAHFNDLQLRGEPIPDRARLARQIRDILQGLAKARLGHEDLHLGNFLLKEGKLYLLDGYAVRTSGLLLRHLLYLGQSVERFATVTDKLRMWYEVGPGEPMPRRSISPAGLSGYEIRRKVCGENRYFGRIKLEDWSGSFFKFEKFPRRWASASRLEISREDWQRELPLLFDKIDADQLQVLKRSLSGDVLAGQITLAGQTLEVIVKRPKRRYWYRYLNEIGRGSRAHRAWIKSWKIIARNLPTAWPLIYLDRRQFGYVTDSLILFERVPGPTLARVDLDTLAAGPRDMLLRRAGRILLAIDRMGFGHFDAKAANWIVRSDDKLGPTPIMVDIDGIRERRWTALGIRRLLKAMLDNKTYMPADSLSLCSGYAPRSGGGSEIRSEIPNSRNPNSESIPKDRMTK